MLQRLKKLAENLKNELFNFEAFLKNQEIKTKELGDKRAAIKGRVRAVVLREVAVLDKKKELSKKETDLNNREQTIKNKEAAFDEDRVKVNKGLDKLEKIKGDSA